MKLKLIGYLLLITINIFSQHKKTCDTPEEIFEDLNTISVSKCNIEEKQQKNNSRTVNNSFALKKTNQRITGYVKKNNKTNYRAYKKPISQELLFSVVDRAPLFANCKRNQNKSCFKKELYKHFSKNFIPENASEDGIDKKIFVQFSINTKGIINNIQVKGNDRKVSLKNEIKRVLNKLPKLKPASHKGIPVRIKYGFPLNLSTE